MTFCSVEIEIKLRAEELRFVRDFVSHGEKLGNASLAAFLHRELGKMTKRYDAGAR